MKVSLVYTLINNVFQHISSNPKKELKECSSITLYQNKIRHLANHPQERRNKPA